MFLPPTSLPLTTADCAPASATTTISYVPDEADIIKTTPTVTVKNTPKHPQKRKKSVTAPPQIIIFLLDFSKNSILSTSIIS